MIKHYYSSPTPTSQSPVGPSTTVILFTTLILTGLFTPNTMRKGFLLGGPVVKKTEETKKDEQKTQTAPAADKSSPAAGGVSKPSAGAVVPGKRRRRTRSLGASLSPSPGRGFFVPGYQVVPQKVPSEGS